MRKTMLTLLMVGALISGAGIVSARMGGYYGQQAGDSSWFNQMYQWMGQHMNGGPLAGYGYCSGAGYNQDAQQITSDEAQVLLEDAVEGTLTSDIYQMGRWYVVFYEDADGNTKQARVDIFTGEVYTDFYSYMSENQVAYRGNRGRMMWGY